MILEREAAVASIVDRKIAAIPYTVNGTIIWEDVWIIGKNGKLILVGEPGINSSDKVWQSTEMALKAIKNGSCS